MGRIADRVHTDPDEVARIEALIEALPNGAHVVLQLDDGRETDGIVAARPVAQLFYDRDGREGTNAVLRLEERALDRPEQAGWQDLWVDRITRVRRLDPQ